MPKGIKGFQKGQKFTEEHKRKLSEAHRGQIPWSKGKTFSLEYRQKLSKAHKGIRNPNSLKALNVYQRGEKNPNWKGGKLHYTNNGEWRKIKQKILKRDNYHCYLCKKKGNLTVHHILPFRYSSENQEKDLITLCRSCHMKEEWKLSKKLKQGEIYIPSWNISEAIT